MQNAVLPYETIMGMNGFGVSKTGDDDFFRHAKPENDIDKF